MPSPVGIAKALPGWPTPLRGGTLLLNALLANGAVLLVVSQTTALDASTPGIALFAAGLWLLLGCGALLELERPAPGQWSELPRPLAQLLAGKALFSAVVALAGALPAGVYTLGLLPQPAAALPAVLYAVACTAALPFFQTAHWLRRVRPEAAPSPPRQLRSALTLLLVAWLLGSSLLSPLPPHVLVPSLLLLVGFAATFWHSSLERLPLALDPSTTQPSELSAFYAFATFVVMAWLQGLLRGFLRSSSQAQGPLSPNDLALSYALPGVLVLGSSLLWLRRAGFTDLRERLGLGTGRGLRALLCEGLLWALVATLVNQAYWWLLGSPLRSGAPVPLKGSLLLQLAAWPVAMLVTSCVAAPVLEELVFRGMLYRALRSRWSTTLSALISTAVFTAHHPLISAVPISCLSVCLTLAFERSRSLYAAMLAHAVYNGILAWAALP